ncbi:MAG: DegT/DnrJ/EryC1/StrS family aminotransferase [Muribaculaceae bacterium]|nr:DegT/DnrJ/EryC1/StrS family aminotransferase [Muribaculaceae bacterium]
MMMEIPFLDMNRLTAPYAEELKQVCSQVIDSGRFLHGEQTSLFESELAGSVDCSNPPYCVAVSNGLDALRLSMRSWVALGMVSPGAEVIVPGNTYVASVLAITDAGLTPVLVDPEPVTMNLDPQKIEEAITPRTAAIMEVHLYGTPARHSLIANIARKHNLLIIEDNAQSIGAKEGDCHTGNMGDVAAFSFYPTKNIGALGDAGAILTHDKQVADTVRALANYGSDRRYHNIYQGFNCRMDEVQAAMLRVKLRHLVDETARRQSVAGTYEETITNPQVLKPAIISDMTQVWHQYVIRAARRDELRKYLADNGVQTDIHYATPPHLQPCFSTLNHGPLPLTELLADEVISLPIASVNTDEAGYISTLINRFE